MIAGERQRDYLRNLERRYRALRERTRALFEAYPDLIFRLDADCRLLDFHAGDSGDLYAPPAAFLGRKLDDVFDKEFASEARRRIREALDTKTLQTWEYSLSIQGVTRHFEARLVPSGSDEVLSIVRDITGQRCAREQLKLTESRLNQAQSVAKIGSWERNLVTNEVWWSDETYRMLGLDPAEQNATYETFLEKLHPDDHWQLREAVQDALLRRRPYLAHLRVILPDGTQKTLNSRAYLVVDDSGKPVRLVGTAQDITERVELEREILAAAECERERIGRDLHDGLGQTLTGISLSLKALATRLERGQQPPFDLLRQIESNVQEAMNETRRVARLLSPRMAGLRAALEALVGQFDREGLSCTMRGSTQHDTHDPEIETHLYRIAQEAVSNAVRHSEARHIELCLECDGRSIRLEVLDDGIGLGATPEPEGLGLRNMRYRAHMINGNLEVESREDGGTRVVCSCPCTS